MGEYTIIALSVCAGVIALELAFLKTGLFSDRSYWIAMSICYAFMLAVNGWFTKLSAPIVLYDEDSFSGIRFPWDIPIEDYLFAFAMLTLVMLVWDALGRTPKWAQR